MAERTLLVNSLIQGIAETDQTLEDAAGDVPRIQVDHGQDLQTTSSQAENRTYGGTGDETVNTHITDFPFQS